MAFHHHGLAERRRLRAKQKRTQKRAKLGTGARFKALVASAKAGGARNPTAVAASIGRKKFGKERFQELAVAGRRRKA